MNKWIIYFISAILVYGLAYYYWPSSNATTPASVVTDHTVTYTDSGFSPAVLTTKKGETITFQNASSRDMRVSSAPHPIHDAYPTTGGCISSTFDSCADIPPGQSWSFTFDIIGTWKYHDHLNLGKYGTIVVQ